MALELTLDFSELDAYINSFPSEDQGYLRMQADRAMQEVTEYVRDTWASAVSGHKLPGMNQRVFDPDYGPSIKTERSGYQSRVYTEYPRASQIEHGLPAVDLKPGMLDGPAAKISREGSRYNRIPFQHASPNAKGTAAISPLPWDVYRAALRGNPISRNSEMGARNAREGWKVGPYAGLRRELRNGKGTYRTYRTVSDKSPATSWVISQRPPLDVVKVVQELTGKVVEEIISRYF